MCRLACSSELTETQPQQFTVHRFSFVAARRLASRKRTRAANLEKFKQLNTLVCALCCVLDSVGVIRHLPAAKSKVPVQDPYTDILRPFQQY